MSNCYCDVMNDDWSAIVTLIHSFSFCKFGDGSTGLFLRLIKRNILPNRWIAKGRGFCALAQKRWILRATLLSLSLNFFRRSKSIRFLEEETKFTNVAFLSDGSGKTKRLWSNAEAFSSNATLNFCFWTSSVIYLQTAAQPGIFFPVFCILM